MICQFLGKGLVGWVIGCRVGSTNVTNVTTLGVVISPRQMSQHQSQHQQQMSNNDKRHIEVFQVRTTNAINVTK